MLNDIENIVFSRVKNQFSSTLKAKYKDLNFTTSNRQPSTPKFPTVYIHMMLSPEQGQTLENQTVNAVLSTFRIEIYANDKQATAKEVSDEVLRIMKLMRFNVAGMPYFDNESDTYRVVSTYRRMIGANDVL